MGEPVLQGLLFADRIARESEGKISIAGIFNFFHTPQVPAVFPPWGIYASVANIKGKHQFSLTLVHDASQAVVFSANGDFEVTVPKFGIEMTFPVFNCVFPTYGDYNLIFFIDGNQVGSRILEVRPNGAR